MSIKHINDHKLSDSILNNPSDSMMVKFSITISTPGYGVSAGGYAGWLNDSACDVYMKEIERFEKMYLSDDMGISAALYGKSHFHFHPSQYMFYVAATQVKRILNAFESELGDRINFGTIHGTFDVIRQVESQKFCENNGADLLAKLFKSFEGVRLKRNQFYDASALPQMAFEPAISKVKVLGAHHTPLDTEIIKSVEMELGKEIDKVLASKINAASDDGCFKPITKTMFSKLKKSERESIIEEFPYVKDFYKAA